MSLLQDFQRNFGVHSQTAAEARHNWAKLCVCGHLDRYHSPTVGGLYVLPAPFVKSNRAGVDYTLSTLFHGCVGALKRRNADHATVTTDTDAHTVTTTIHATCPCEEFRPVARVDRPNRYFNQQLPIDREDPARHPFNTGVRAFTTHLSRRKAATADPEWAAAELERRFTWLDGARECSLSHCLELADVWPVFVNGDGLSELRCPAHRG